MSHRPFLRATAVALVAACVGCPGNLEDPSRFSDAAGSCPDVPTDVFAKTCSTTGCHSTIDKMLGLDLQAPGVASRLVGVKATGGPELLIDPSNPAMSAIYTKLTDMPPFGTRMPFGEPPLDDATIACVLQWITVQVGDGGSDDGDALSDASSDDAAAGDDATSSATDASATDSPYDAGKAADARAPTKDASAPGPDASIRDAATVNDAAAANDAKAD
jgi:hypothetical protein